MFNWGASWQLMTASWAVLRADKELLWFPVISGITMLLIFVVMFIPSVAWAFASAMAEGSDGENTMQFIGYIFLFLFYIVTYTINIYFSVALVGAALKRLDGKDPTVSDGFRIANERFGKILGYAVISATVGVILNVLRSDNERWGWIGRLVVDAIGLAWNVATFLVIPVMIVKDLGPFAAVKESATLLKKTWGEQITGNFGIGGIFVVLYILVVAAGIGLCGYLIYIENYGMAISTVVVAVFLIMLLAIMQGALNGIFQAALYRYAETGSVPSNFDAEIIKNAFKEKKKRGIAAA